MFIPRTVIQMAKALRRGQIDLRLYMAIANERGNLTLDQAFVDQYHSMLQLQFRTEGSMLSKEIDPMVIHRGVKGQKDEHDRLSKTVANDIVDRDGDTRYLNPAHTRRWANLVPSDGAVLIDRQDRVRTLIDPQSSYRTVVSGALGNRSDLHIVNAAVGTAATGVDGTGTQALPTSQLVAIGSSPNNVLTLAKIKSTSSLLSKAGVPQGPKNRLFLYSPGQDSAILAITQAASSDFTAQKIYDRGSIDGLDWMGFHWIMVPDVEDPDGTNLLRILPLTSTTRTCIAMSRRAVGLSIGEEIQSFIDVLPTKRHATQVRSEMDMGAVRVWDREVVSIAALEE